MGFQRKMARAGEQFESNAASTRSLYTKDAGTKIPKELNSAKAAFVCFLVKFAIYTSLFYALFFNAWVDRNLVATYLDWSTRSAAGMLTGLGFHATARYNQIRIDRLAVNVRRGCDALEPIGLLGSAVIAFPRSWKHRLKGICIGVILLGTLNLARIISLVLVKRYCPSYFDFLHLEIWPVMMAFTVIAICFVWGTRLQTPSPHPVPRRC